MSWPAIDKVRRWVGKRQGLLAGLVGVAVEETIELVPGARLAVKIVGEIAKHGVERLAKPEAEVPDVKAAGQAFPTEQLDQINAWLETLTTSYAGLLDKLETLPVKDGAGDDELTVLVKQALQDRQDIRAEFDAHARDARRLTLSLSRIEEKLDVYFHGQQKVALSLEEIKALFVKSPLLGEWTEFRQARPDAVKAIRRADEHFLAGRRDDGAAELLALLRQRGVGQATLCRLVGLRCVSQGDLGRARTALEAIDGSSRPPALTRALSGLSTAATRGSRVPVWRSLPRDFVVNRKFRVETEVGRGGMASVYRCLGASQVRAGEVVAVKVPAPWLMADTEACRRFVQEIEVSQRLSAGRHPGIVQTLGYEVFDDPHTGRELYGLVLEYIDGMSLAQLLAQRQAKNKPLQPREVVHVLKPVCEALAYAHAQGVCHRDVKPPNVLLARGGHAKLTDFGIARVLEDCRATRTGQADVGTPVYMPPDRDFDARSDVYLLGNLLLELLTFDPRGDVEARADCPTAWAELVADSMNRLKGKRPQTARDFLARLEVQQQTPPPPPPPPQEITKSLRMKLVRVPRGTFWMGDRGSQQQVAIPHEFYLGAFPVTQEQWQAVMGSNPSWFSRSGGGADKVTSISEADLKQFPVEQVSWDDVLKFLKRFDAHEKDSSFLYRLPTEAEWEYACRGGASSQQDCAFDFYFGDPSRNLSQPTNDLSSEQANFDGDYPAGNAPKGKYPERTTKVGSYKPNRLGIYDMHGNVWEWCKDQLKAGMGSDRVFRGGCWDIHGSYCRASYRLTSGRSLRNYFLGFRLAAAPSGE
jgi:formylglycine-generating enzyme required for sulfatase activity